MGRRKGRGKGFAVDAEGQIDRSDLEVERASRSDRKRFSDAADDVMRRLLALPDPEEDARLAAEKEAENLSRRHGETPSIIPRETDGR